MSMQSFNACAKGLSVFADALIWNTSEQTTSIWTTDITVPKTNVTNFTPTNFSFDASVGFRGGFLYEPEQCFWDTKLYWTYFPASTDSHHTTALQIITPEFFSGFLSGNFFFGANLDWQLTMNMLDLEASHQFNLTNSLSLRPSIGIKGGTIKQTINAKWDALIYVATEKVENNFLGVGPSLGIEGKWNVYDSLNLVGDFSAALLWGNWNISDVYKRPSAFFGLIKPATITSTMKNSKLGTLMLDYFLGLKWTYQGRSQITLQAGYEMQYWANQLRFLTFQQLPVHGDLTLQGGTCGIYIDF